MGQKRTSPGMPETLKRIRLEIHDGRHRLPVEIVDPSPGSARKPGAVMLFLHEGLGSIAQWRDFPLELCRTTGLPAVVYERWGYGGADPLDGPRTVRYLHDEALRSLPEVLRQLRIDRSILIGHSDGGSIALIFASAWPERVLGIITEAAHVFVEEVTLAGIQEAVRTYASSDLPERLSRYHGGNTDRAFRGWSDIWLSPAFREWNIEDCLAGVRCPVLAIQGRDDEYGTPAQVAAIVRGVSGPAEPLLVPGCGHVPHHQARCPVLDAMTRFVRSLAP